MEYGSPELKNEFPQTGGVQYVNSQCAYILAHSFVGKAVVYELCLSHTARRDEYYVLLIEHTGDESFALFRAVAEELVGYNTRYNKGIDRHNLTIAFVYTFAKIAFLY